MYHPVLAAGIGTMIRAYAAIVSPQPQQDGRLYRWAGHATFRPGSGVPVLVATGGPAQENEHRTDIARLDAGT